MAAIMPTSGFPEINPGGFKRKMLVRICPFIFKFLLGGTRLERNGFLELQILSLTASLMKGISGIPIHSLDKLD